VQELGTTCRNFLVAGTCVVVWWMDCFVFMFYAFVWKHDVLEPFCMSWKINYGWNVWFGKLIMAAM
jgi:hypothetical protein